jgi:hypothetical protein
VTDPDAFNAFEAAGWEAKAAGYAARGSVVGLDISSAMVAMASELHPEIESVAAMRTRCRSVTARSPTPRAASGWAPEPANVPEVSPLLLRRGRSPHQVAATAAATTCAIPASPRAFGWNGAAACVGSSGSTHFVDDGLHASWPMLAV